MGTALQIRQADMSLPIGNLDAYILRANQISMLSAQDEHELAVRYYEKGDVEAARQLVLPHLRFVIKIARNYLGYGLSLADLIQEGNIGLMKAIKRFDPFVGVRLVSFAVHWIKAEIHEFILRNWRIVKVATTKAQRKLFFNLRHMKKRLGWFSKQEVDDVAKELDVEPKVVLEMEARLNSQDMILDNSDDSEESNTMPINLLADHSANPAALMEASDWEDDKKQRLYEAFQKLDERSQDILKHRWLAENKKTLQSLADQYQVSAERIRQLEKLALDKLKGFLN